MNDTEELTFEEGLASWQEMIKAGVQAVQKAAGADPEKLGEIIRHWIREQEKKKVPETNPGHEIF